MIYKFSCIHIRSDDGCHCRHMSLIKELQSVLWVAFSSIIADSVRHFSLSYSYSEEAERQSQQCRQRTIPDTVRLNTEKAIRRTNRLLAATISASVQIPLFRHQSRFLSSGYHNPFVHLACVFLQAAEELALTFQQDHTCHHRSS